MSISRLVFRGLLLVIIAGLLWVMFQSFVRSKPDYYLKQAQAAMQAGNTRQAVISLNRMVQKFPKDARGFKALATAIVTDAKLPDTAEGYARMPQALNVLVEAGKLNKDDLELQNKILSSYLRGGRMAPAAATAPAILKAEPKNADALYAVAWQKADARDFKQALALLDQQPEAAKNDFRVLSLRAQVLQNSAPEDPQLAATIEQISTRAKGLSAAQMADLPEAEFEMMTRVLPAALMASDNAATAFRRGEDGVSVCETLAQVPGERSKFVGPLAAQLSAVLTERFFTPAMPAELAPTRDRLAARLEKVLGASIAAAEPDVLALYEAALLAFTRGDYATAVPLVEKAIVQYSENEKAKKPGLKPETAQMLRMLAARARLAKKDFKEGREHLEKLLDNKDTSGQAHLLLGSIAASEGRQQEALTHFSAAEQSLGSGNPLVQISLAQTLPALGRWAEALPYLKSLHEFVKSDNPEVQAWIQREQITDNRIHFHEARALFALKRYPEAQQHLAALRGTPLEPRAIELEADNALALGKPADAERILAQGLEKFPKDGELIARRASVLDQMGKRAEAESVLASAASAAPDDLRFQLLLAREYSQAGKHEEALGLLASLQEKHPDSLPIQILRADALIQAGRLDEANALGEKLSATSSSPALGSLVNMVSALKANDPKKAAESLRASGESAKNLQFRHLEGEVAAIMGDFPAAIAALGESVQVTGLRSRAGPLLCHAVARLADKAGPAAAQQALAPVVAAAPDEPFVIMAHADVLAMLGKYTEALKALDHLDELEKSSPVGPHLRSIVFSRMNDAPAALKELRLALSKDPAYLPSLALAAQLQYAAKNYPAAIEHAKAGLTAAPQAWQLAVLKSEAEWAANRQPEAVATIQQLVAQQPELADARRQLVNLQTRGKQYDAALATCRAALEKFPNDASLHVQEVVLLSVSGQAEASEAKAKEFIGDPPDAGRALSLANAFVQVQNSPLAARYGELALAEAKDQDKPAVHQFLGGLAMAAAATTRDRQTLEKARDHFAAVVAAVPTDFVAGNNLAWLLAVDFNQPQEAVPVAERTRGNATTAQLPLEFLDTLATVYRRAGQFDKALVLLDEAFEVHPADPLVQYHLGMTLGRLGRTDRLEEAKQLLNAALKGSLSPEKVAEIKQELQRIGQLQVTAAAALEREAAAKAQAAAAAREREAAGKIVAGRDKAGASK